MGRGHAHALYVHGHGLVHRLPPHVKIVAAVAFVLGVAVTPREAVWAFGVQLIAIVAVIALAGLRPRFVVTRAAVVVPFLFAAALLPFVASGERVQVLGVPMAVEGLWGAWGVSAKASLGVLTSVTLAATTEVPRLLRGMERLHVPGALTQIATFMVRYLEVVAAEVSRQRSAMLARGYDPRWLWQAKAIGASAGTLFVRSYERGERVHAAMLARGYAGGMPPPPDDRPSTWRDWVVAGMLPCTGLAAAAAALWMVPG